MRVYEAMVIVLKGVGVNKVYRADYPVVSDAKPGVVYLATELASAVNLEANHIHPGQMAAVALELAS